MAGIIDNKAKPSPPAELIIGLTRVAGLTKNIATSAFQLKLELGLRLSLAKITVKGKDTRESFIHFFSGLAHSC